ncbi:hypothetical protein J3R74_000710 [Puniceicoccus vermicola]|uniref:Alpha-L-fucosidase n=1 Tax=Puniceicoccus vermicola TaxID=388746 RepID=A0A7X1E6B7_9BACT|nr:alpha-L-fucosidase [Puniceicoccus vermicola]
MALYHSLNNWMDQPDSCDALESKDAYEEFIGNTFERIRELVTRFNSVDVLWYDGWWPFNSKQWKAEEMNAHVGSFCPHLEACAKSTNTDGQTFDSKKAGLHLQFDIRPSSPHEYLHRRIHPNPETAPRIHSCSLLF